MRPSSLVKLLRFEWFFHGDAVRSRKSLFSAIECLFDGRCNRAGQ